MQYIKNLVSEAVEDIRQSTVDYIVQHQIDYVERLLAKLEEHDWDVDKAFPRGDAFRDPRSVYKAKTDTHNFIISRLTVSDEDRTPISRRMNDPHYRVRDDARIEKLIQQTRYDANVSFEAFVIKLTEKIGLDDVETIKLDETHKWLWNYSILHVTRKEGTKEKWKTQIITKTSCLGTVFNQWPTRKVK